MGRRSSIAMALALALALVVSDFIDCEAVMNYAVGDGRGWTAPPNITAGFYDEWSANKSIEAGDVLNFDYNGTHSLAAVSKEEYDTCAKVSFIDRGGNGHGYGYRLPRKAGTYYFICTEDSHCQAGQKLAINVTSATSAGSVTSPPPLLTFSAVVCAFAALFLHGR